MESLYSLEKLQNVLLSFETESPDGLQNGLDAGANILVVTMPVASDSDHGGQSESWIVTESASETSLLLM